MGKLRLARVVVAYLTLFVAGSGGATAAPPGPFQVDGNALIFDDIVNVTENGSQLIYPTFCADPGNTGRSGVLTTAYDTLWRTTYFDPASQKFTLQAGAEAPFPALPAGGVQGRPLLLTPIDSSRALKVFAEIFTGTTSAYAVGIFDLRTSALERVALTLPGMPIAQLDLDGDGIPEIILLDNEGLQLSVMDAHLTHELFEAPITFAVSKAFAIGKFDKSGQPEIVTSAGLVYGLGGNALTPVGSIPAQLNG